MECPFCAEEIKEEAVICRHCQRDIGPYRLVLRKIANLEGKLGGGDTGLAELTERVAAIEHKLDDLKTALGAFHGEAHDAAFHPAMAEVESRRTSWWKITLLGALAPIVLLLVVYTLTVLVYDLDTRVLRVLSILTPLPFGFWLARSARRPVWNAMLIALVVGAISVWAMSAILAWQDQSPILPQNLREWREVIEYVASIAFSYLTGALVGGWLVHRRRTRHAPSTLARQLARVLSDDEGKSGNLLVRIQRVLEKAQEYVGYVIPVLTGIISVYTGLKPFLKMIG